jgi:hypothetical protein
MKRIKYVDINQQLSHLDTVLSQSLIENRLDIAELNKNCRKYKNLSRDRNSLKEARYVVYSKHMTSHHNEEIFIFLNDKGETVETIHGNEFWLYGMIKPRETIQNENSRK